MTEHVLVIGAGASGLMAASILSERSFKVTVLEARDRIGGRICTLHNGFSIPVETGAEFIHGEQPLTMSLVEESKTVLSRLTGNHFRLSKGELQHGDFFNEQWNYMLQELQKLKSDMSMASFLEEHFKQDDYNDLRESVKGFVEGFDAADLESVSAMALKEEWSHTDDEHQYHIRNGYSALIHHLEKKVQSTGGIIILSSPVNEIQWSDGKVSVSIPDGHVYEADKVIVTIPLGVLQKDVIRFSPSLPKHEKSFKNIGFGGVIKFLFEFNHPFWETQIKRPLKDIAFLFSDAVIPTWWSQLPDKTPILTGWLGGPSTRSSVHTPEVLYEKAITSLSYIFNCPVNEIEKEIKQWHIADWLQDRYASGAYAYATVDTHEARKILLTPVNNTIYFAGEAVYDGAAMGTVEAALVSGRDVALKISG